MSNKRATDFRFIPAEAFGLHLTDHSAKLVFGLEIGTDEREDQVGVVLTLRSLKVLGILASEAISSLERNGVEVDLPPNKVEEIHNMFAQPSLEDDETDTE